MRTEQDHRRDLVEVCRRMYAKDLIAARDGNVSIRMSDSHVLATPSGVHKGFLTPEMGVVTDMDGRKVKGSGNPSTELKMHLGVYRVRPDVCAVVHAHAPISIAFTLAGISLSDPLIPEVVATLGAIPTIPYATPTTFDLVDAIAEPLKRHNAMIMERHGTLTVGCDIFEAFDRLETVEHTAKIVLAARTLGQVHAIPADEVARLTGLGAAGEPGVHRKVDCAKCRASGTADLPMAVYQSARRDEGGRDRSGAERRTPGTMSPSPDLVERIVAEVRRRLA